VPVDPSWAALVDNAIEPQTLRDWSESRMKRFSMFVLAVVAIASTGLLTPQQAQARLEYYKAFKATYEKLDQEKVDTSVKCGICHGGDKGANKKKLSKYAEELKTELGAKQVKDEEKIKKALKAIESKTTADGKKYGDLLKEGTFPPAAE
jgi:hypothetical protein